MSWIWICPADRTRPALQPRFSVVIAKRPHPFPFRTRKLSSSAPMVLHGRLCGRVGRRRILTPRALTYFTSGPVSFPLHSPFPFPPQQPCYPTATGLSPFSTLPDCLHYHISPLLFFHWDTGHIAVLPFANYNSPTSSVRSYPCSFLQSLAADQVDTSLCQQIIIHTQYWFPGYFLDTEHIFF